MFERFLTGPSSVFTYPTHPDTTLLASEAIRGVLQQGIQLESIDPAMIVKLVTKVADGLAADVEEKRVAAVEAKKKQELQSREEQAERQMRSDFNRYKDAAESAERTIRYKQTEYDAQVRENKRLSDEILRLNTVVVGMQSSKPTKKKRKPARKVKTFKLKTAKSDVPPIGKSVDAT